MLGYLDQDHDYILLEAENDSIRNLVDSTKMKNNLKIPKLNLRHADAHLE